MNIVKSESFCGDNNADVLPVSEFNKFLVLIGEYASNNNITYNLPPFENVDKSECQHDEIIQHIEKLPIECDAEDIEADKSKNLVKTFPKITQSGPSRKQPQRILSVCEHCNKQLRTINEVKHHQKLHASKQVFACTICKRKFARNHNLEAHIQSHNSEKAYACNYCEKKFSRRNLLTRHITTNHMSKKESVESNPHKVPFICEICNKSLSNSKTMRLHLRKHSHNLAFTPFFLDLKIRLYPFD